MPSQCKITVNKEDQPYMVGHDTVEVSITLITTTEKNIKSIHVGFHGRAKVCFIPESLSEPECDCDAYVEEYPSVCGERILPADTYAFKRSFTIPANCMSSMEGQYGHIRYEVSLLIVNKNKYKNVFVKPISVIRPYDLNSNPKLKESPQIANNHANCLCFTRKSYFRLITDVRAYAPGQPLKFTLEGFDKRSENVDCYTVRLVKTMQFIATDGILTHRTKTETDLGRRFLRDNEDNDQVTHDEIIIPSTPPTTTNSLICVEYCLVATAKLSICTSDLRLELPIIIGTIPIKETLPPNQQVSTADQIKPRSFEMADSGEVTFVDVDVDERNRTNDFLPLYPMYKREMPTLF